MKQKKNNTNKVNLLIGGGLVLVILCVLLVVFLQSGDRPGEEDDGTDVGGNQVGLGSSGVGTPSGAGGSSVSPAGRNTPRRTVGAKTRGSMPSRPGSPAAAKVSMAGTSARPSPTPPGAAAQTSPGAAGGTVATPKPLHTGMPPAVPGQPPQAYTLDPRTKQPVPYPTMSSRVRTLEKELAGARQAGNKERAKQVEQELQEVKESIEYEKKHPVKPPVKVMPTGETKPGEAARTKASSRSTR